MSPVSPSCLSGGLGWAVDAGSHIWDKGSGAGIIHTHDSEAEDGGHVSAPVHAWLVPTLQLGHAALPRRRQLCLVCRVGTGGRLGWRRRILMLLTVVLGLAWIFAMGCRHGPRARADGRTDGLLEGECRGVREYVYRDAVQVRYALRRRD